MAATTRVISDEAQVPPGFVSLKEIARNRGEQARGRASYAHRFLGLPAVKLMRTVKDRNGPVWVDAEFFDALEQAQGFGPDGAPVLTRAEIVKKLNEAEASLRPAPAGAVATDPRALLAQMLQMAERTQALMERQAVALERIAGYCDGGKP